jgi:hypothetical protein
MKDKNSPKKTASIFESIIKASVSGNPKPKDKKKKSKTVKK